MGPWVPMTVHVKRNFYQNLFDVPCNKDTQHSLEVRLSVRRMALWVKISYYPHVLAKTVDAWADQVFSNIRA